MVSKAGCIEVCNVQGEISAHMVKLRLESHGIPSMIVFETYFNLSLGVQCPCSVVVPEPFTPAARKLLQDRDFEMLFNVPKKVLAPYAILRILSGLLTGRF